MHARIYKLAAGAAVALSLFGAVGAAQASSLTQTQVSAIISLLQSFGADQGTISNVSSALGGQAPSNTLSCASFSDVSYGTFDNAPGGRVSQLQTWLGIPSTTFGFGTYGRKTQAAWNATCGGMTTQTQIYTGTKAGTNPPPVGVKGGISANPTTGAAPLTVTFSNLSTSANGAYINFGDGSTASTDQNGNWQASTITHTYTTPGTYTATLNGNMPNVQISAGVPIIVTGSSTSATPSATIDQSSLTTGYSNPTITGSAQNMGQVFVAIVNKSTGVAYGDGSLGTNHNATVTNGRWSFTPTGLANGTYAVTVQSTDDGTNITPVSGTLTVAASATSGTPSTMQIQSVMTLLQSFGANSATQADVQNVLNGQTFAAPSTALQPLSQTQASAVLNLLTSWGFSQTLVNNVSKVLPIAPLVPTPTATIDQSSLTTSSDGPTITGSANGVSSVYVAITAGANQAGTASQSGSGQVPVVNGRWNVTIYPKADVFTAGVYSVSVYTAMGGTLLSTGTLSILGNALQPTANITANGSNGPITVPFGSSVTIGWTSANTSACGIVTSGPASWGGNFGLNGSKETGPLTQSISYVLQCTGSSSQNVTDTVQINVQPATIPSATIDQTSLRASAINTPFVVTGTASGAQSVRVSIGNNGKNYFYSSAYPVVNGRWSVPVSAGLDAGTYGIVLFGYSDLAGSVPVTGAGEGGVISGGSYVVVPNTNGKSTISLGVCPANTVAQRGQNGQQFACTCPANFTPAPIWGSTYYADDSDICTAGIQAGQLNQVSGGLLYYTIGAGQTSYAGSTQNGITSQAFGSWSGSFAISGPKG